MRALRILVAALIGLAAMVAVFLAAVVVFFAGLAALVLHFFRGRPAPARPGGQPSPNRTPPSGRTEEIIEVVSTKVPADPAGQ